MGRPRDPDEEEEEREDSEEVKPVKKKQKPASSKATSKATGGEEKKTKAAPVDTSVQKNASGDEYFSISEFRRITVNEFKGDTKIDFREYYKDKNSGELKPGKAGISLTVDQWKMIKANIATIDGMVAKLEK